MLNLIHISQQISTSEMFLLFAENTEELEIQEIHIGIETS